MAQSVLLVWEHGGNLGHLARLIPIAVRLRERGTEVSFSVADTAAACRYLTPLGLAWSQAPPSLRIVASGVPLNHADILLRSGFAAPVERLLAAVGAWQAHFAAIGAQAVLADASPMALYAARAAKLPVLCLGHGFEIPPAQTPGPCFTPWVEGAAARAANTEALLRQRLQELAERAGGPATMADMYPPAASLLCAWPELDHFDRADDARQPIALGPIWNEMAAEPAEFSPQPGPRVLCYLNIVDKRLDLLWQALRKAGANVLVLSPNGDPAAADAARGWGLKVIEQAVAIQGLLPQCDAVIGHGGMGLTSMALHAGKPLLLLPQNLEQGILAHRLFSQQLAAGTVRLLDRRKLQRLVDQLLDPAAERSLAAAFSASRRTYTPSEAVERAVNCLSTLI